MHARVAIVHLVSLNTCAFSLTQALGIKNDVVVKEEVATEEAATKSAAAEESATKSNGEPASLEDVTPSNGEPASLEDEMILLWPTGDDWRAAAELADKLNSQLGVAIDMVLLAGWVAVARVATESSQCMDTSCIGNRIHYIVSTLNSVWAGKITGMFLENDIQDLQEMLCVSDNSKAAALFVERVWQALGVLAQAFSLESPCYQDDETPASAKTFPEETASAVSALQPPAASPAPLYAHTICIRPLDRARAHMDMGIAGTRESHVRYSY